MLAIQLNQLLLHPINESLKWKHDSINSNEYFCFIQYDYVKRKTGSLFELSDLPPIRA